MGILNNRHPKVSFSKIHFPELFQTGGVLEWVENVQFWKFSPFRKQSIKQLWILQQKRVLSIWADWAGWCPCCEAMRQSHQGCSSTPMLFSSFRAMHISRLQHVSFDCGNSLMQRKYITPNATTALLLCITWLNVFHHLLKTSYSNVCPSLDHELSRTWVALHPSVCSLSSSRRKFKMTQ